MKILIGIFAGLLNGIFGSGGGIIAVTLYRKGGFDQKKAQATSLFLTVLLSSVSVFLCFSKGDFSLSELLPFLPGGILGAVSAGFLLKKISPEMLKKLFGAVLVFSGARILWGIFF